MVQIFNTFIKCLYYAPNFEKVEGAYCAPNFEKVEGAYCFGLVRPCFRESIHYKFKIGFLNFIDGLSVKK